MENIPNEEDEMGAVCSTHGRK